MIRGYDPGMATAALVRTDPRLAALIETVGPCRLESRSALTPFQALLRSVVYQQLSGRAAGSIHARLCALFPRNRPTPSRLLALPDESLREAGLSRGKLASLRDLAARCLEGTVPDRRTLARLEDEAIIERLVEVRGIGRWTVEMLLIFHLDRPDVLPVTDLGVRKGAARVLGRRALPEPRDLLRRGERWRPWRSVASWYLWRASELP